MGERHPKGSFGSISRFIPVRQEGGEGREVKPLALVWLLVGHLVLATSFTLQAGFSKAAQGKDAGL